MEFMTRSCDVTFKWLGKNKLARLRCFLILLRDNEERLLMGSNVMRARASFGHLPVPKENYGPLVVQKKIVPSIRAFVKP